MKGLLIKDFRLILQQKKLIAIYLIIFVCMCYFMEDFYATSFFMFFPLVMVISTISYDWFDNGMPFLMTLPNARKVYTIEKFLFSCIVLISSEFITSFVQFIVGVITDEMFDIRDIFESVTFYLPIMILFCCLIIPTMLKFGVEKGRIVIFLIFGGIVLATVGVGKIIAFVGKTSEYNVLYDIKRSTFTIIVFAVILPISIIISNKIMEKREF